MYKPGQIVYDTYYPGNIVMVSFAEYSDVGSEVIILAQRKFLSFGIAISDELKLLCIKRDK